MTVRKVFSGEPVEQIRQMVRLLAEPAPVQEAWLSEYGFPVDELALQIYDVVPSWLPELTQTGSITASADTALRHLEQYLQSMTKPSNVHLFDRLALHETGEWENVRQLARRVIAELGGT